MSDDVQPQQQPPAPDGTERRRSSLNTDDIEFFQKMHEDALADLPSSLIVTNVHTDVFSSDDAQAEFEALFSAFDTRIKFEYFRSFRRVRITFDGPQSATQARIHTDMLPFRGRPIRAFFAQINLPSPNSESNLQHLSLPPLEKQFLISPPCSPPVGWEQSPESAPVINHDLLARLAVHAQPDCVHTIQPETETSPAIVVHPCLEVPADHADDDPTVLPLRGGKIQHTRCPAR